MGMNNSQAEADLGLKIIKSTSENWNPKSEQFHEPDTFWCLYSNGLVTFP
jgi:hypothetical protein